MPETSDTSQIKTLEMGKVARHLALRLKSDYLTADDMLDILTPIATEPAVLKQWGEKLNDIAEHGVRKLLRDRGMLAETYGLTTPEIDDAVDVFTDKEPWLIPPIRRSFTSVCRQQFSLMLAGLDPLTRIGSMRYFMLEDGSSDSWQMYNPEIWTSWHGRGTKATLTGSIKFGKTNFGLLMAEMFLARGIDVKSNIAVKNPPKGYSYCSKLSDLLKSLCESRLAGHEVNIIFDEANLFWHKTESVRPRNVDLGKLALCFGKLRSSLLFVSHYTSIIPTIIVQTAVARFQKTSIKSVWVEILQGIKMGARVVAPVPACGLLYDPDQLQWFSLDMDIERLFSFLGGLDPDKDQWTEILGYIKTHTGEMTDAEVDVKAIAQWLRRQGRSMREIADITERPLSTVGQWCKGMT